MNLWKYTQNELPSEKEFFEIGQSLISNLSMHLSIEFKIFKESVEPKSWFHADIRGKCHKRLVHLIYDGILVYCFKQGEPVVDVVFLVFSNGSRVRLVSGETILTLHYTKNLEWTTPTWEKDTYLEWECDSLEEVT